MVDIIKNLIRYHFTLTQITNRIKYIIFNRKKEKLNYRPIWILLYLTDLCNLHCGMCPHHTTADASNFKQKKQLNNNYMPLHVVERVLYMFPESYYVMIAGVGEPFLHPEIKDIITLCAKSHKKIKIVTNGSLLNDQLISFILREKSIDELQISLNAPNWKIYNQICQGSQDEYETLIKNILVLVRQKKRFKSQVKITISAVCSNEFKPHAKEFLLLGDYLGVDRVDLFRYIDFQITGNQFSDIESDHDFITELSKFAKKNVRLEYSLPHIVSEASFSSKCDWFWKNISVDSVGNIGSCGRVIGPDKRFGSIFDSGDIWNNDYFCAVRRDFLEGKCFPSSCCKSCVENNIQGDIK